MSSKLRWRCRRGTKELDILLEQFLDEAYDDLSEAEQADFEDLLAEQDPVLAGWIWGGDPPPERWRPLIDRIRKASSL